MVEMVGCFKNKLKSEGECVCYFWVWLVLSLHLTYNGITPLFFILQKADLPTHGLNPSVDCSELRNCTNYSIEMSIFKSINQIRLWRISQTGSDEFQMNFTVANVHSQYYYYCRIQSKFIRTSFSQRLKSMYVSFWGSCIMDSILMHTFFPSPLDINKVEFCL